MIFFLNLLYSITIHTVDIIRQTAIKIGFSSIAYLDAQKEGKTNKRYCVLPIIKNGAGIPSIKRPESLETAIPSTLLLDIDTISKASINPMSADKKAIPIFNPTVIWVNENTERATIVTTKEMQVGNPNLDIKYPFFPSGVTAIYFDTPSSISPKIR